MKHGYLFLVALLFVSTGVWTGEYTVGRVYAEIYL